VVFEAADIEVPQGWSQVAVDIMAQKYFRKAGVPTRLRRVAGGGRARVVVAQRAGRARAGQAVAGAAHGREDSRQLFNRLAGCWTYWGWKHGYFADEDSARVFYDELTTMLASQIGRAEQPAVVQHRPALGLRHHGAGAGPQLLRREDRRAPLVEQRLRAAAAARVLHPVGGDDLVGEGGIMDLWVREARLFKYGSGTGTNFSSLRGEGEPLSGGGRSSGLMSFLRIGDRAAGAIKSGGTTRRAAKMVVVDVDHPDVERSSTGRSSRSRRSRRWSPAASCATATSTSSSGLPHQRATRRRALRPAQEPRAVGAGDPAARAARSPRATSSGRRSSRVRARAASSSTEYDTDWDSSAYSTVSGQNSNNSVRVTDEFLRAVENDGTWDLIRRTDGKVHRTVRARELWDKIAMSAWACADPGLQFDTTINEWHTCPADGASTPATRAPSTCSSTTRPATWRR
jgi:ribonucleoside-diphosphate reductase alpha chain